MFHVSSNRSSACNQATIIGGRNVGDEYFDAGQAASFADLDVLAVGPVVSDVAWDFERYWVSPSSCPADRVLPPADTASIPTAAVVRVMLDNLNTHVLGALYETFDPEEARRIGDRGSCRRTVL